MEKKISKIISNTMLFWIFSDIMPGFLMPHGIASQLIDGLLFAGIMYSLPIVLGFFRFPANFWGKFFVGTLFTTIFLYLLDLLIPKLLHVTTGYVGGADLLFFSIPRFFSLPAPILVIIISAIILVICSIILDKLYRH